MTNSSPDERDIFEVANQIQGYVGPDTPEPLAQFRAALSIPADDGVKGEEAERIKGLEDFQKEVMGWLRERGLVDFRDDEWDGFTSVIEEHEAEIEAAAIRETTRALSTASTAGKG